MDIGRILAQLFPPSLESLGKIVLDEKAEYKEQGACGNVRRKKYRDGIERMLAEQRGE